MFLLEGMLTVRKVKGAVNEKEVRLEKKGKVVSNKDINGVSSSKNNVEKITTEKSCSDRHEIQKNLSVQIQKQKMSVRWKESDDI